MSIQQNFLTTILSENSEQELQQKNQTFKQQFLAFSSETDENLECLKYIEYGKMRDETSEKITHGIKIKDKNILISDIMNAIEDLDEVPAQVKEYFPALTNTEWQATTRVITVLFLEKTDLNAINNKNEILTFKKI
ncbi:MAG: hypothetical protein DRQ49_07425 [Gammaproteobacteria bacterium]|nr:MAG: hypothetical protein DRQ49_07425 [Gammaproteobacteria bacterium]RKZ43761.1 MAG: hypothetical protein DRQ41_04505 [Gammaproteobacteria bacterium]RKZ75727.1 MAG: hypothetical protein DRQ57_06470 [Gammaproteobacteria bacterium]